MYVCMYVFMYTCVNKPLIMNEFEEEEEKQNKT